MRLASGFVRDLDVDVGVEVGSQIDVVGRCPSEMVARRRCLVGEDGGLLGGGENEAGWGRRPRQALCFGIRESLEMGFSRVLQTDSFITENLIFVFLGRRPHSVLRVRFCLI